MRRFTIAIALSTLLLVAITSAQQAPTTSVPNLIRYGGTLKDAQGAPMASSTLGVTFAIYKQQDGGAPIWMETQNVTTDAAGNYSVLLGSTTATGLPGDLFSQQEQRWLGVEVQGQTEQPRVMMVSVPYAFKAHEAETLGGRSVSDFVLATGTNSSSNSTTTVQAAPASGNNPTSSGSTNAASAGPTNFSGSTTDQIVGVTQSGTGYAIAAQRRQQSHRRYRDRAQRHGLWCPGCGDRYGGRRPDWHRDFHHRFYLRLARNFQQHVGHGRARHRCCNQRQHHRHQRLRQ